MFSWLQRACISIESLAQRLHKLHLSQVSGAYYTLSGDKLSRGVSKKICGSAGSGGSVSSRVRDEVAVELREAGRTNPLRSLRINGDTNGHELYAKLSEIDANGEYSHHRGSAMRAPRGCCSRHVVGQGSVIFKSSGQRV